MSPGTSLLLAAGVVQIVSAGVAVARSRAGGARAAWLAGSAGFLAIGLGQILVALGALGRPDPAVGTVPAAVQLAGSLLLLAGFLAAARARRGLLERAASSASVGEELARSERRYRFLVGHLPEAFVVVEGGTIRFANRAFTQIFGVGADAAVGRTLESFVAPEDLETLRRRHDVEETTGGTGVHRFELHVARPDGERRWVEMRSQLSSWEARPTEIVLISDASQRRRTEERFERLHRTLTDLGPEPAENIGRLTAACGEILGGACALYQRLEAGTLRTAGVWQAPEGYEAVDRPAGQLGHEVIRRGASGGILLVRDLPRSPFAASDPNVLRCGLQAYAGHAVSVRGETIGALGVAFRRDAAFDAGDERILGILAETVAVEEDRGRASAALRESVERFRSLYESNPLMCFTVDARGTVKEVNQAAVAALGFTAAELVGSAITEVFHPLDRAAVDRHLRDCLARPSEVTAWELRKVRRDGAVLWVRETAQVVATTHGEPEILLVCENISERKRDEELKAAIYEISEAAQQATTLDAVLPTIHRCVARLMAARNFYIALYDPAKDLISFPYFVDEADGPPAPRHPGRGLTEYILRTGRPLLATPEVFDELCREGEAEAMGAPSIDWLGVPLVVGEATIGALVVQTYTAGVRYGAREKEILTFVSRQVALAIERTRAQELLRQSEEKHRRLVDTMQEGVVVYRDGRVVFANPAFAGLVGLPSAAIVGREVASFIVPEDRAVVAERFPREEGGGGEPGRYELRALHGDGVTQLDVAVQVTRVDYEGKPAVLATVRDLTERKRLEHQLRLSQRFEALGQLAGGVAHDFNNLLMAILGSTELLRKRLAVGGSGDEELATIFNSSRRAADLTRGLLAFARRQVLEAVDLDLDGVVGEMLPILRRVLPENIAIDSRCRGGGATVRADRGQMDQILMNLAVNARDAMPAGGTLRIVTERVEIGDAYVESHPWARPGPHVRLLVADDGAGMDRKTLAHIFEPFYTTKAVGRGTGLGLAIVYGIVKQHGGMIDASSAAGAGTTIEIYLPIVVPRAAEPAVPARPASGGGDETILVVEDETDVRRIIVEVLEGMGYRVLSAVDGVEALELLGRGEGRVDLVVSDVVMPRMGGEELHREARRIYPDLLFLFSSGYGDALVDAGLAGEERAGFIAKPYTIGELAAKVREMLDRLRPASA